MSHFLITSPLTCRVPACITAGRADHNGRPARALCANGGHGPLHGVERRQRGARPHKAPGGQPAGGDPCVGGARTSAPPLTSHDFVTSSDLFMNCHTHVKNNCTGESDTGVQRDAWAPVLPRTCKRSGGAASCGGLVIAGQPRRHVVLARRDLALLQLAQQRVVVLQLLQLLALALLAPLGRGQVHLRLRAGRGTG